MMKSLQITFLIALLLPMATDVSADTRPARSGSYKSGFSSQKPLPTSSNRAVPAKSPSFGAFGRRPPAPVQQPANAPARPPSSSLSKSLDQGKAEANAVRTLEARRAAAQAAAPRDAPPAAANPQGQSGAAPMPAPVIVHQDNGFGNMMLGFLLGRSMSGPQAHPGYPGTINDAGQAGNAGAPSESSFGATVLRTFAWLLILGLIGWLIYFGWKFLRRGRAPGTANYTFERN